MANYPLNFGWHTLQQTDPSDPPDFTPVMPTLLGTPSLDPNVVLAKSDGNDSSSAQTTRAEPPRRGTAPNVEPTADTPEYRTAMDKAVGHIVVLPDGSRVEDPTSETGYLMSPVPDLTPVAVSGRQLRKTTEDVMQLPDSTAGTLPIATWRLWKYLGHGGEFDYQRQANPSGGWFQYPQFRNVSNFNVDLLGHQAGISLETLLGIAGGFSTFIGKPDFTQPHWLKKRTEDFIRKGYAASESGALDPPSPP